MFKKSLKTRPSARAFTLSESAIVLLVMSVLFGGIWTAWGLTSEGKRVSDTIMQIGQVAQNIREYYKAQNVITVASSCSNTANLTTSLANLNAGIFLPEMQSGTTVYSAIARGSTANTFRVYGSATTCDGTGVYASRFRIVLTMLSKKACARLLFSGANFRDPTLGVTSVCASASTGCSGGTTAWADVSCASNVCTATGYMTLEAIEALCSGTSNEIGWEFKLRN